MATQSTEYCTNMAAATEFMRGISSSAQGEQRAWNRVSKTDKLRILTEFAGRYAADNELDPFRESQLVEFFKSCLDRKTICKTSDVQYDRTTSAVTGVPGLMINPTTNLFTIRRSVGGGGSGSGSSATVRNPKQWAGKTRRNPVHHTAPLPGAVDGELA